MQYVQIAMAALQLLTALVKAINELKANGELSTPTLDLGGSALVNLGKVAKIDELSGDKVAGVMPEIREGLPALFSALKEVHSNIQAKVKD